MTPADQHALREALARAEAERDADRATLREYGEYIIDLEFKVTAAEAENTRLKETVEAAEKKLAKATETYTDPSGAVWGPVPAWVHFAACQSSRDLRAARSVLATIPPKENPDA